jgi:glutathione S-transferase
MKLYGDSRSGNCYKIQLLLSLLKRDYTWCEIDILKGDTQQDEFLNMNPNGKIPLLELDDGRFLSESNAILGYLAEGSALVPQEPYLKAKVYQWMFFEQYTHEPCIAVARFIQTYLSRPKEREQEYQALQAKGHKALAIMELELSQSEYLVGNTFSLADIALYAYTHVADEGGFDLKQYPKIQAWCQRIEGQSGYRRMG